MNKEFKIEDISKVRITLGIKGELYIATSCGNDEFTKAEVDETIKGIVAIWMDEGLLELTSAKDLLAEKKKRGL